MTPHTYTAALSLLCLVMLGPDLEAQGVHRCPEAIAILERGSREATDRWAASVIGQCGTEGASVLAKAIAANAGEHDIGFLSFLTSASRDIRDPQLVDVAVALLNSPEASVPARIFAVRTLIYQFRSGTYLSYADLQATGPSRVPRSCLGVTIGSLESPAGSPIDSTRRQQVVALAQRIRNDTQEPDDVRAAASCIRPLIGG
jgi:hypothetical protein